MKCDKLKAMTVLDAYQLECNDNDLVYLKSDADKVIAALKESTKSLILDNYLKGEQLRHQKHKRCLWLAAWCACRSLAFVDENWAKSEWYDKWKFTWRKLADKFKEDNG